MGDRRKEREKGRESGTEERERMGERGWVREDG